MPRRLPPDTRLDWRDPNMPVERNYEMPNGTIQRLVDPEYERRYREHLISMDNSRIRHWRNNPTYHLRKPD